VQQAKDTLVSEQASTWSDFDRAMMGRALELAAKGIGQVSPGPLVGCVIVAENGEIAGEGFYLYEELQHAEIRALAQAKEKARGGTAYISLEPHAHQGRTPPCTDALIAAGIRRVVAAIEDPNPEVSGQGFARLRAAGIQVCIGLLSVEAAQQNEKYFHFMRTGRPFVHLKLATSLDGKVATRTGDSRWITGEESRARVHELRHEYDAILVGAGTVVADDPLLTDRSGKPRRRPLLRVVLDERCQLSPETRLARTTNEAPVLVFTGENVSEEHTEALRSRGIEVVRHETGGRDPMAVLKELGKRTVQGVLVEGGPGVAGNLIEAGLVNKLTFFVAPLVIGGGQAPSAIAGVGAENVADAVQLRDVEIVTRGCDLEITGYPGKKGMKDEG
jgi:diaminohydroxyphosphoribosylaminopyrimidine deaminase / 5-amino-6-(5-phosphoribosylamino)uracil reductase